MGETHNIEYKRELTDNLEKEVIAFLNSNEGGEIFLGIDDSGDVVGLKDANGDSLKIKDRVKFKILPSTMELFKVKIEKDQGKNIIRLKIESGREKPYYIAKYGMTPKGCFRRVGTAAEPMTERQIEKFFGSRTRNSLGKIRSDKQNLSFARLRIYYEEQGKSLNDQFANNLELTMEDNSYNYNAYLLSDINTTSFKLARFEGTNRSKLISSEEYGNTCIITAAKKILDKLDVENKTTSTIDGDRTDVRLWNQEALREAVRNAFVHNDYSTELFPTFTIFSDRLEISTHGGLPIGLSQEEFFLGYSVPRNKVLMRVFRDVGLVESLGIGIPKILESYDKSCFVFSENYLRMEFPKAVKDMVTDSKHISNVASIKNVTARQKEILEHMSANPKISITKLAGLLKINRSAVQRHIRKLKIAGILERKGGTRGSWIIILSKT